VRVRNIHGDASPGDLHYDGGRCDVLITLSSKRIAYSGTGHPEHEVLVLLQLGTVREDIYKSFSDDVFADLRCLC
jgi:hypothetical protein